MILQNGTLNGTNQRNIKGALSTENVNATLTGTLTGTLARKQITDVGGAKGKGIMYGSTSSGNQKIVKAAKVPDKTSKHCNPPISELSAHEASRDCRRGSHQRSSTTDQEGNQLANITETRKPKEITPKAQHEQTQSEKALIGGHQRDCTAQQRTYKSFITTKSCSYLYSGPQDT